MFFKIILLSIFFYSNLNIKANDSSKTKEFYFCLIKREKMNSTEIIFIKMICFAIYIYSVFNKKYSLSKFLFTFILFNAIKNIIGYYYYGDTEEVNYDNILFDLTYRSRVANLSILLLFFINDFNKINKYEKKEKVVNARYKHFCVFRTFLILFYKEHDELKKELIKQKFIIKIKQIEDQIEQEVKENIYKDRNELFAHEKNINKNIQRHNEIKKIYTFNNDKDMQKYVANLEIKYYLYNISLDKKDLNFYNSVFIELFLSIKKYAINYSDEEILIIIAIKLYRKNLNKYKYNEIKKSLQEAMKKI